MPQLEFVTYLSQIFWLFVFFILLYMISLKYTIPTISSNLKVRKKFLQNYSENISGSDREKNEVLYYSENLVTESFGVVKNVISTRNQNSKEWLAESFQVADTSFFKKANQNFIYLSSQITFNR